MQGLGKTKKIVPVLAGIVVLMLASAAYALWSATASGNSEAKALTAQAITVSAGTAVADLFPGGSGAVYFTLTNTNPYPVTFTDMAPGAVVSSDPGNCAATNVTAASKTGLSLVVPANTTSGTLSIPTAVSMAVGALDGCQGVTFTVPLTLTGSQS